jgi:hypothetical protein
MGHELPWSFGSKWRKEEEKRTEEKEVAGSVYGI